MVQHDIFFANEPDPLDWQAVAKVLNYISCGLCADCNDLIIFKRRNFLVLEVTETTFTFHI